MQSVCFDKSQHTSKFVFLKCNTSFAKQTLPGAVHKFIRYWYVTGKTDNKHVVTNANNMAHKVDLFPTKVIAAKILTAQNESINV